MANLYPDYCNRCLNELVPVTVEVRYRHILMPEAALLAEDFGWEHKRGGPSESNADIIAFRILQQEV